MITADPYDRTAVVTGATKRVGFGSDGRFIGAAATVALADLESSTPFPSRRKSSTARCVPRSRYSSSLRCRGDRSVSIGAGTPAPAEAGLVVVVACRNAGPSVVG
jgi:hypothetical protein